jgi:hypothetical protein
MESNTDRKSRLEFNERQRSQDEEVKLLIDNVLLAISVNSSMPSVHNIHQHMAKYVTLPESLRTKNYVIEFV